MVTRKVSAAPATRKSAKRTSTKGKKDPYAFENKIARQVMRAPALLTKAEVDRAERTANLRDWVRRAMWRFLAMSGKETVQKCRNDRDFAVALALMDQHIAPYVENLKQIIGFMEALEVRIMIALAVREDMNEIIAEAKRDDDEGEEITIDNVHRLLAEHEAKKQTH